MKTEKKAQDNHNMGTKCETGIHHQIFQLHIIELTYYKRAKFVCCLIVYALWIMLRQQVSTTNGATSF